MKLNNSRRLNHPVSITQFNLFCSSENWVTGQPHVCLTSTYYFNVSFTTAVNFSLLVCKSCIKPILLTEKKKKKAVGLEVVLTTNILLYVYVAGCYNPLYSRLKKPCHPSTLCLPSYLF